MFYFLYTILGKENILFNVFKYISFRSAMAFITSFLISIFLLPKLIKFFKKRNINENISDVVPISHKNKVKVPSMGGLIIIISLLISSSLWNNLMNLYVLILILATICFGMLGFLDDYLKNIKKVKRGLIARYKLLWQFSLSISIVLYLYYVPSVGNFNEIAVPFLKDTMLYLGILFIPFAVFVIVGSSNAVNLTDGLDGLAAGTSIFTFFGLGIVSYLKGHFIFAEYLKLDYILYAGELTIFIAATIGSLIAFLWYNIYPAKIFMGDTGSLTLGGLMAVLSILLKEELFFAIIGTIFIVEALSSLMQTFYFKYTKKKYGLGKRIFKKAPLHHHFEEKGIMEVQIVIKFWIVASVLLTIGLATLKLR